MGLAKRLEKESTDEERIVTAFVLCFSREPEELELGRSIEFLQSAKSSSGEPATAESRQLLSFCQALFSTAEFRNLD